eukprot:scaffold16066_cov109-Cylindrotheca_fusiformis.AAC.2
MMVPALLYSTGVSVLLCECCIKRCVRNTSELSVFGWCNYDSRLSLLRLQPIERGQKESRNVS